MMNIVKIVMNETEEEEFAHPIRQVCMPLMHSFKNMAVKMDVSESESESESESADDCSINMIEEEDDVF
jgi:hypothetical protein